MKPHPFNTSFDWSPSTGRAQFLDAEQIAQFDRDGYVVLRQVIDHEVVDSLVEAIDELELQTEEFLSRQAAGTFGIATAGKITFTLFPSLRSEAARSFCKHPALVGSCADLVGPDVRLYWDQAVYKKPEPNREFPWHQDNGYTFIEPQQYLTCWVPLTSATTENGCPWVIPGGHLAGTLAHWNTDVGFQCIAAGDAVAQQAMAAPVEPGDVVVFSSLTPHRTGPNETTDVRKAYIVQYCPIDAEIVRDDGTRQPIADPDRTFTVLQSNQPV